MEARRKRDIERERDRDKRVKDSQYALERVKDGKYFF